MARGPGLNIAITEKRFPGTGTPLLVDFALTIAPGSVIALHGPSGVGKSTLLRLIAGIDSDFAGSITIDGLPAHEDHPPGFVFQDARLLPWLTALDNIRLADPAMSHAKALSTLAQVGLADHATAWPRQLSGGMQRRVAFARALASNARLLLLDEPFISLDSDLVNDMHWLLAERIAATRPTIVFTSHQPADATRLADRIITLEGRPAKIVHDQHLATRGR